MKQVIKKVYTVSKKADNPRLWLQHLVCEAAGLKAEEEIYISVNEENQEIIIQNRPINQDDHILHVSSRISKTSGKRRPLVDSAKQEYASILSIKQKVEICVYKDNCTSRIVVRPLRYKLLETATVESQSDERLRLLSVCAGAGIGTGCLKDTNAFTPVMEIEFDDDSCEVLRHNYPHSYLFNGDIRDVHEVVESDVAFVSLPCSEHSSLGHLEGNVMNNLFIATAKILMSSQCKVLFFENVPAFYKSEGWFALKELLLDTYPYWQEKNIESYDFGAIATRNRTYSVAFSDFDMFQAFQFPKPPNVRRRKLKDYLDGKNGDYEWKSLEHWMTSFESREAWKDRSLDKTFVDGNAKQINAIPKRYRSQCASNTYVLSEDKKKFRFLTENEIRRILRVPEWFEFCEHTPKTRRFEMLGQSVSGEVIRAIGNSIATVFMKQALNKVNQTVRVVKEKVDSAVSIATNGQLELII
ncbi:MULTISPECIES: DNA cytosine methyltransferase [Metabacillus]|uniref:DNA cytosine methyltransferase n=1 Tax=Metabacillus TaxID=2675233 RepID=UPI00158A1319|nr:MULTISPECIES: DNA cytosine methyltransferase [Metabacillus]MCM3443955.1 DNA cytosine methyltransferase [Metabacillus halosaccharovorans]